MALYSDKCIEAESVTQSEQAAIPATAAEQAAIPAAAAEQAAIPAAAAEQATIPAAAAEQAARAGLRLFRDEAGLVLAGIGMELRPDFNRMLSRVKPHNLQRELLVRACRVKARKGAAGDETGSARPIHILDATAGLGEDSLLLAAAGFRVTMYESDPVIAALLREALCRGREHPDLAEVVERMELVEGDSIAAMMALASGQPEERGPDVIYLDPMFPERQKSGKIKKKFQLLQCLESPCANEEELLATALAVRPQRIVIKRPLKGAVLAAATPSFSLKGKAIRYDCIVL